MKMNSVIYLKFLIGVFNRILSIHTIIGFSQNLVNQFVCHFHQILEVSNFKWPKKISQNVIHFLCQFLLFRGLQLAKGSPHSLILGCRGCIIPFIPNPSQMQY